MFTEPEVNQNICTVAQVLSDSVVNSVNKGNYFYQDKRRILAGRKHQFFLEVFRQIQEHLLCSSQLNFLLSRLPLPRKH